MQEAGPLFNWSVSYYPSISIYHHFLPCLGEDISGPSGKVYTLEGTSNFTQCYKRFTDLIKGSCNQTTCGMNGEFQPNVKGHFYVSNGNCRFIFCIISMSNPIWQNRSLLKLFSSYISYYFIVQIQNNVEIRGLYIFYGALGL